MTYDSSRLVDTACIGYSHLQPAGLSVLRQRYRPSILLIPRQLRMDGVAQMPENVGEIPFNSLMEAFAEPAQNRWLVRLHRTDDNIVTTAFAMTYCVFTGGEGTIDPRSTAVVPMYGATPAGVGTWTTLD